MKFIHFIYSFQLILVNVTSIYRLTKIFEFYLFCHVDFQTAEQALNPSSQNKTALGTQLCHLFDIQQGESPSCKIKSFECSLRTIKSNVLLENIEFLEHAKSTISTRPTGYKPFATCRDNPSAPEHGLFWTHLTPRNTVICLAAATTCRRVPGGEERWESPVRMRSTLRTRKPDEALESSRGRHRPTPGFSSRWIFLLLN